MAGVSIVGSGNLGASAAFFIAESSAVDVTLVDLNAGLATGKALDMMEGAPLRKYRAQLRGADSIEVIKDAEVVIVAAGVVRKPGAEREALFDENGAVVAQIARDVTRLAPKSVVIVASEPVDAMTALFVRESGFPRNRVMGLGGALDSERLRHAIAQKLALSAENISALVVGAHSKEMIGLSNYCRVSGVPLPQLMKTSEFDSLMNEVRTAGDEIVKLAGRTSSFYAPGAIAAQLAEAVASDLKRVMSVSVVLEGEYGAHGGAVSLPAVIGRAGIVKVLQPKLDDGQKGRLVSSAEQVKALAATGVRK